MAQTLHLGACRLWGRAVEMLLGSRRPAGRVDQVSLSPCFAVTHETSLYSERIWLWRPGKDWSLIPSHTNFLPWSAPSPRPAREVAWSIMSALAPPPGVPHMLTLVPNGGCVGGCVRVTELTQPLLAISTRKSCSFFTFKPQVGLESSQPLPSRGPGNGQPGTPLSLPRPQECLLSSVPTSPRAGPRNKEWNSPTEQELHFMLKIKAIPKGANHGDTWLMAANNYSQCCCELAFVESQRWIKYMRAHQNIVQGQHIQTVH